MRSLAILSLIVCSRSAVASSWSAPAHGCKVTPADSDWPSAADWAFLNDTLLGGALIETRPVASSCYPGNPFGSTVDCADVTANWGYSDFHLPLPESISYPWFANNSCLTPEAPGYHLDLGCHRGGYPSYVVNATTEHHIARAMRWASERRLRIVIKGTGHEINGRSSGAYALSIWTHNLAHVRLDPAWPVPGSNATEHVLIAGSGAIYSQVLETVLPAGRVVINGGDHTVGLGGHIQGGGHGPFSSTYGMAADQVLQARLVTTQGEVLVADAIQNQDLLWAIRGGGPGQYGVVTEYVLRTHPAPANVIAGGFSAYGISDDPVTVKATWDAFAITLAHLPDLMDATVTGTVSGQSTLGGVAFVANLSIYNSTCQDLDALLQPIRDTLAQLPGSLSVSGIPATAYADYMTFSQATNSARSSVGGMGVISSRLLGRKELVETSQSEVARHLRAIMGALEGSSGGVMVVGLVAGAGPRNVDESSQGALHPAWRDAYVYALTSVQHVDTSVSPQRAMDKLAIFTDENQEAEWRKWAPEAGAYINEANPFISNFQKRFYGRHYEELERIKRKYDPTESLFILSGVGSDRWDYDLDTGKLCRTGKEQTKSQG